MTARLMGIVNANPDSFSDPGARSVHELVVAARELVRAGADIVDVGGESGVTHVPAVSAEEERDRVLPLVERLVARGVTVSVDTWKPEVAEAVLAAGASMINDVSGLRDPAIADACARHDAELVVMHTRAEPKTKSFPEYDDVGGDVKEFLRERTALALSHGVARDKIVVDPGPDFTKTPAETVAVLQNLDEIAELGYPILLALSRKDFIGAVTGRPPAERLGGTLGAIAAVGRHASILRVHDVAAVADFLRVWELLEGPPEAIPALDPALRREDPVA
jgi:dihydropteroate synthase